jgi:hypothetical protein
MAREGYFPAEKPRYIQILPIYQNWMDDQDNSFSQFSIPVYAHIPLSRNTTMTFRGSRASMSGESLANIQGITDTQFSFQYHVPTMNMVFHLGMNLPSGKSKLSSEEFETSIIMSQNIFDLQVPNFGQGFNLSPGFIWAVPLGDSFILGLGASYQYRGPFDPLENLQNYDPGDEILLTGGFDVALSSSFNISGDVILTSYDSDKIKEKTIYNSGNKVIAMVQLQKSFTADEFSILAKYRSKAKNEYVIGGEFIPESEKLIPDQSNVVMYYKRVFSKDLHIRFLAEGRFYEETDYNFSNAKLYGVGLIPEIRLSRQIMLPIKVNYLFGTLGEDQNLTGLDLGAGLLFSF